MNEESKSIKNSIERLEPLARISTKTAFRLISFVGRGLAELAFILFKDDQVAALRKIEHLIPEMDSRARVVLLKKHFCHQFVSFCEMLILRRLGETSAHVTIGSWPAEAFEAISRGEGVLCVSAHFGNPYVLPRIFPHASPTPGYLKRKPHRALRTLVRWFQQYREQTAQAFGFEPIDSSISGVRRALHLLKTGNFVIVLGDLVWGEGGLVVDLLGHDWRLSRAPGVLALRSGARVLFVITIREEDGTLRVDTGNLLECPKGCSARQAGDIIAQSFASFIRPYLAKAPEQWLWSHDDTQ